MENAVEALKMAFAFFVLVMALTVSIISFNKVKAVSDVVLYTKDETNYYDYQGATGKEAQNRIVGLETIIPTLYKYYKENYTILFREAESYIDGEFTNVKPLNIYNTPSNSKTSAGVVLWGKGNTYDELMQKKYSPFFTNGYNESLSKEIFSFDLQEETLRHEPWTGSYDKTKENIDRFLDGTIYNNPNNNSKYIDYSKMPLQTGGFIGKYKNKKFVETVGEYTYSTNQAQANDTEDENGSTVSSLVKDKKKRIIVFTLIK